MTTKTEARAAIREAREYLRDMERALRDETWGRAWYGIVGDEPIAALETANYTTRAALELEDQDND